MHSVPCETLLCALAAMPLTLAAAAAGAEPTQPLAVRPDGSPNRAVWMARGSFGVMTHYLIKPKGETPAERTAELNRIVDQFDLDGYIGQLEETGADWLIFTLGQTTGYLCSPNSCLDALEPGLTPRRDLVMEIAQRLERLHKKLILYIPSEQNADPVLQRVLRYGTAGHTQRYFEFLRAYATSFGPLVSGWWFDSCGPHPDAYWEEWLAALRAGNPDTAVAFSGAEFCCGGPISPVCKLEDYHAGEIHLLEDGRIRRDFLPPGGDIVVLEGGRLRKRGQEAQTYMPDGQFLIVVLEGGRLRKRGQEAQTYMPDGQFLDGVQWHALLPLDLTFNPAVPNAFCRYPDKELFAFVDAVKAVGGALTLNVPIDVETGRIPTDSHAQLVRLRKHLSSIPAN